VPPPNKASAPFKANPPPRKEEAPYYHAEARKDGGLPSMSQNKEQLTKVFASFFKKKHFFLFFFEKKNQKTFVYLALLCPYYRASSRKLARSSASSPTASPSDTSARSTAGCASARR
jgi:hypothetical protein